MQKFFLYARKSTDVEDKQVLSIEAQLDELRDYAKREAIEISAEYVEKQSAKIPGRPIFRETTADEKASPEQTVTANAMGWHLSPSI